MNPIISSLTSIDLSTISAGLWNHVGYMSKVETICFAAPLLIWGAGASEGAIRSNYKVLIVALKTLNGSATDSDRTQLHNQWSITKGCSALTAVSLIPFCLKLLPFNYFFVIRIPISLFIISKTGEAIVKQIDNYQKFKAALEKARKRLEKQHFDEQFQRIIESPDMETFQRSIHATHILPHEMKISPEDFNECEKNLQGTLINQNWSYTIAYRTVELASTIAEKVFLSGRLWKAIQFVGENVCEELKYSIQRPSI